MMRTTAGKRASGSPQITPSTSADGQGWCEALEGETAAAVIEPELAEVKQLLF